ncbi:MAG: uncharacterized protein QG621_79 [Patescibacteria group bacterium]|nr:uncharacterized protein [Patescibacteria group bacterium]
MAENEKNKGDMSVHDAGKKGGDTTASTHGPEFYSEIGRKGGQRVRDLTEKGKESEEEQ